VAAEVGDEQVDQVRWDVVEGGVDHVHLDGEGRVTECSPKRRAGDGVFSSLKQGALVMRVERRRRPCFY
jgi:hypothetical protein